MDLDEVFVKFEAKLEYGTLVAKSGVEFCVKDGNFCPAIAKAVKTMKKGEKVLLKVKPHYGFGEKGKPVSGEEGAVLPPNVTLNITLELVADVVSCQILHSVHDNYFACAVDNEIGR